MHRRATILTVVFAALIGALAPVSAATASADARYELANGCYALRTADGGFVAKRGDGYAATARSGGEAEPLRMRATTLGRYLLYGRAGDFLATNGDSVAVATQPGETGDWRVDTRGDAFTLTLQATGRALAVDPASKALELTDAGGATRFTFVTTSGCATFPESEVGATGDPTRFPTAWGEVSGLADLHMHMMAFEFLGGRAHCGKPWSPYGVTVALVDCPDHYPNGAGAILENGVSHNKNAATHDPVGWPTFKDWPSYSSLTHEQSYYKWLERAWRGGLRVFVNLLVENKVLCEAYPYKQNSCDEMDAVRLQNKDINALQDYIDAQYGGPGKGWFRLVTDPFEARKVISEGKLAVIKGIEVSEPFGCREFNDQPMCDAAQIDRELDEVYNLGVRDMELINKFDNALAGVAGDNGTTGLIVNNGNRLETGSYWQMETCTGSPDEYDREQPTAFGHNHDDLIGNGLEALVPSGVTPLYGPGPHCNKKGLTPLGAHAVTRMMDKGMIIDPDHLSVRARNQLLPLLEARRYSGVVSSHSWSTLDAFPRIYKLGGMVTPYAGASTSFVEAWKKIKPMRDERFYWGFGYGADMNGFGAQGPPRPDNGKNPVRYPFKNWNGTVTLDRVKTGERSWDVNQDGVAHYGLYPDWIEDLRKLAGDEIVADMGRGAEAYLQMWERAVGVPASTCRAPHLDVNGNGIGGVDLGATPEQLLRRASQPRSRGPVAWRWCVSGRGNGAAEVVSVLDERGRVAFVASTARGHRALRVGPGAKAPRLGRRVKPFGRGLRVRAAGGGERLVYGVRGGRVRFVAVAARTAVRSRAALRKTLQAAGLS